MTALITGGAGFIGANLADRLASDGHEVIVFDALAVFLFPWVLVLRAVGLPAFWVMAAFVAIIGLGWAYAYREGVLEWK